MLQMYLISKRKPIILIINKINFFPFTLSSIKWLPYFFFYTFYFFLYPTPIINHDTISKLIKNPNKFWACKVFIWQSH
ncbi:hypothetical protein ABW13_05950 [Pluralibacter gergoviae]|nr:hypothetical protein ABW13_05950 [Pluralibacter gergoviae]